MIEHFTDKLISPQEDRMAKRSKALHISPIIDCQNLNVDDSIFFKIAQTLRANNSFSGTGANEGFCGDLLEPLS